MKQIYHHFKEWEDYQNGMYDLSNQNEELLINKAKELLSDQDLFFKTSLDVIYNWKKSTDVNLTNKNSNRRSWIGQSACCYAYGVPELLTRVAWGMLTDIQRKEANLTADKIIRIYEEKNRRVHNGMGEEGLF